MAGTMAGMAIQTQIRHNAEDIRSYFVDLRKWEKEMKEKERTESRRRQTVAGAAKECLPQVEQHAGIQVTATPPGIPHALPIMTFLPLYCRTAGFEYGPLSRNKTSKQKTPSPRERDPIPQGGNRKLARDLNSLPAYYSAWERFNVDEELEKIDRADESTTKKERGLITAPPNVPRRQMPQPPSKVEE
ncbi:hypothetical protein BESB_038720 [Besnoitia besnoiti]|uniref:Uncharacterized protein n=1 Tax=Besnoitia besnoiti TaxID=94643 RepID=A0A2A9MJQ7_BESBE|nr:hypothetical protein BESB_038720 [Besnoitia besnoiti]PFH37414.1 hypothetical protein BESB_038720 [Besnoitia besnoiti]